MAHFNNMYNKPQGDFVNNNNQFPSFGGPGDQPQPQP